MEEQVSLRQRKVRSHKDVEPRDLMLFPGCARGALGVIQPPQGLSSGQQAPRVRGAYSQAPAEEEQRAPGGR